MVQHDCQIGHRSGEIRQLGQLRKGDADIERQPHPRQHARPGAVSGAGQHALRLAAFDIGVRVPGHGVANATEAVRAGGLQGLQHRLDLVAKLQIGAADDGGCRTARAVGAAGAGRRQPLDKLDLADRPQLHRPVRPVHRAGLDEHGGAHIVACADIGDQLVQQVALIGNALQPVVPEMMMRIADRDLRLQRLLAGQRQPVVSAVRHVCISSILQVPAANRRSGFPPGSAIAGAISWLAPW